MGGRKVVVGEIICRCVEIGGRRAPPTVLAAAAAAVACCRCCPLWQLVVESLATLPFRTKVVIAVIGVRSCSCSCCCCCPLAGCGGPSNPAISCFNTTEE